MMYDIIYIICVSGGYILNKIGIMTDSNSGITQSEGRELGVSVIPMPFYCNEQTYYEEIDLSQEKFFDMQERGAVITTSMPTVGNVSNMWDQLLETYDEVIYIPMSSGLSSSCETATIMADEYDGRVEVVNNHRISVTQRQSVLDALELANEGWTAKEIKQKLESVKHDSSIYIMVDTMTYLKRGGRVTTAAAALGALLRIKPVLQIQGEKLDLYAKARNVKQAKNMMFGAMIRDFDKRFNSVDGKKIHIEVSYTKNRQVAEEFAEEIKKKYPENEIVIQPLSLSISCHIGPGALAIACSKKIEY